MKMTVLLSITLCSSKEIFQLKLNILSLIISICGIAIDYHTIYLSNFFYEKLRMEVNVTNFLEEKL